MSFTQQTETNSWCLCKYFYSNQKNMRAKTKCEIFVFLLPSNKYFECSTRDIAFVLIPTHVHMYIHINVYNTPTICKERIACNIFWLSCQKKKKKTFSYTIISNRYSLAEFQSMYRVHFMYSYVYICIHAYVNAFDSGVYIY